MSTTNEEGRNQKKGKDYSVSHKMKGNKCLKSYTCTILGGNNIERSVSNMGVWRVRKLERYRYAHFTKNIIRKRVKTASKM